MFSNDELVKAFSFIKDKLKSLDNIDMLQYSGEGYEGERYCEDMVDAAAKQMQADWHGAGVTKSVFYFYDIPNMIFKFPFEGRLYLEWDDEISDYDEDERYVDEFEGAWIDNVNDICWDYCAAEAGLFREAIERNVDCFFAGTYYLGTYMDKPIYVSEYCPNSNVIYSKRKEEISVSIKTAQSMLKNSNYRYCPLKDVYIAQFIELYGYDKTESLLKFIYDFGIDDLHRGNLGWDKDGILYLVDYSGYDS